MAFWELPGASSRAGRENAPKRLFGSFPVLFPGLARKMLRACVFYGILAPPLIKARVFYGTLAPPVIKARVFYGTLAPPGMKARVFYGTLAPIPESEASSVF